MPRAKNATRIGARERQHHEPPYTHRGHKNAARGKRRPRTSHTHYRHTTGALRRPAREKRTARAQLNLNATARPRSKDSSSTATCRSRPLPPFDRRECRAPVNCGSAIDAGDWTGPERGASPEARCRAAYTKHDLLRRGPCGGQRVGLQLVESSTTGPKRLPLPCRSPPVVRARRHPRCRNS